MIWITTILLLIYTLFAAGKDSSSFLLSVKDMSYLTSGRIKRWHRDGVILFLYTTAILAWASGLYWIVPIQALLVRLSFFDLAFNYWSQLPISYLGGTSLVDKFFSKIFGRHGALIKSGIFLIILVLFNIFV